MAKKKIISLFTFISFVFFIGLFSAFFYLKTHLKDLLGIAQKALQKQNISFTFETVESPSVGLSLVLGKPGIQGSTLPISLQAERLSISLGVSPSWPPLALKMEFTKTEILTHSAVLPSATPPTAIPTDSGVLKILGSLAPLFQFKVNIEDLTAISFGIEHLSLKAQASGFRLSPTGLHHFRVDHDLSIQKISQAPWLLGLHTKGTFTYHDGIITSTDLHAGVGPFLVHINALYDLHSQNWSSKLSIPKAALSQTSQAVNLKALNWVKPESGEVFANIEASGLGSDTKSIRTKGTIRLENASADLTHPSAKGKVSLSLYSTFSKETEWILDVKTNVDMTELGIVHEDTFSKERGIPLRFSANIKGNEDVLSFPAAEVFFHNLHASSEGTYSEKAKSLNIRFKVSPTSLAGWEKFFPKYSNIHTQGNLEMEGAFNGELAHWEKGTLNLNLNAQKVKIPLLKSWVSRKDLQLEGIVDLTSLTKLELSQSAIRSLSTQTEIDLKETTVSYSEMFYKKQGTPLAANLLLQSSANKAEIRKADLLLGTIRANARGTVDNFSNPSVNLKVETVPFNLIELLSFLPSAKSKAVTQVQGMVGIKANLMGPLLSKEGPRVSGVLDLRQLAAIYELDDTKKKIHLSNLTTLIQFTKETANTNRFYAVFPHTQLTGAFDIKSFSTPELTFSLQSNQFQLTDFYDLPKGQGIPPGAVPIPISHSKSKKENDFRSNPLIPKAKIKGTVAFKNTDLGYMKTDALTANITLDSLLLQINPFMMHAFGGKVTSVTEWNGRSQIPVIKQTLKVDNVNASQFIGSYTDKAKDVLDGSFSTDMEITFSGMEAEEIKKSLLGTGTFSLKEGHIKTVRFTKQPMESLKKIPLIGRGITKTDWDEKLNDANGSFQLKEGKLLLSNLILHTPYFDAKATNVSVDMNQNLQAKLLWFPKSNLISEETLEVLKDEQGAASLPLLLTGTLTTPQLSLDASIVQDRLKAYAGRKVEAEKTKAVNEIKKRTEEEIKKKLGTGLGNIFK